METIKSIARWWRVAAGLLFIGWALGYLFSISVPTIILGVLCLVVGILLFFDS